MGKNSKAHKKLQIRYKQEIRRADKDFFYDLPSKYTKNDSRKL